MVNLEIFSRLNFFGQKVELFIENRNSMKTNFGSILSLIFIIILGFVIYLNILDLFLKQNPISYQQRVVSGNHPKIFLNSSSFLIEYNISDASAAQINMTNYFELKIYHYTYVLSNGNLVPANATKLSLVQCPTINGVVSNHLCFDQNFSLMLEGYWGQNELSYLSINLHACDKSTNPNCHDLNDIFAYAGNKSIDVNLYFNLTSVQVSNFSSPLTRTTYITYKYITNQRKITNFLIQSDSLTTDKGFLLEDLYTEEFFNVQELQTDTAYFGLANLKLYSANFYSSNISNKYRRSYIKIQDVFAKVGGISNIIFIIFKVISSYYAKIKMNLHIMKAVYYEESKSIHDNLIQISFLKNASKINNCSNNSEIRNVSKIELKSPHTEIKKFNEFKKDQEIKKSNLKLDFCDVFRVVFMNKEKISKQNLIEYLKYESNINHFRDISTIIRKLEEFENLKKIILSEEQSELIHTINPQFKQMKNENVSQINELVNKIQDLSKFKKEESVSRFPNTLIK